jgi:phosphoribosyl-ATP pyrophosphohydrolase/phosphoribosyl-AMP cyclohydrolase
MIKLKIDMNDMESVGDLFEFIEEVFIKRNWDLFLSLVLEIDKDQLIELINKKSIDQISQKIDMDIQIKEKTTELKSLLNNYRIGIFNPNNNQKLLNLNSETNFDSIDNLLLDTLDFEKQKGLIPTIVQDLDNIVLMLAYSSRDSLKRTITTRKATYFSRSRNQIWIKGEQSGNTQIIKKIYYDCDADTLLFQVDQNGFACHTGSYSCFQNSRFSIPYLYGILNIRIQNANSTESYTKRLSEDYDLLLSKIKEESLEVINYTDRNNLIWEIADLTYFILVLMATQNITPREIVNELRRRNK